MTGSSVTPGMGSRVRFMASVSQAAKLSSDYERRASGGEFAGKSVPSTDSQGNWREGAVRQHRRDAGILAGMGIVIDVATQQPIPHDGLRTATDRGPALSHQAFLDQDLASVTSRSISLTAVRASGYVMCGLSSVIRCAAVQRRPLLDVRFA